MENNDVKFNLHRLKSLILHNKYYNSLANKEKANNIILLMNKYINNLKEINLIYTLADIESIKYNETNYPDTLLNNELLNRFNFYSIILGYIDGNIDYLNKHNYFKEDYYNESLFNFISFRERVISDFNITIFNSDSKILIDTLNSYPCYKNFLECFFDISNKKYSNVNNLEIILSYTIGYINFDKFNLYKIYNEYLKLVDEFNQYKFINKEKVNKIKIKKNNK